MTAADGGRPTVIRLLICDDYAPLRAMLAAACTAGGGVEVVGQAGGGREALEQARLLQPDVILLDVSMPDGDGFELLARLPEVAPAARAIVLSGLEHVEADAERLGAVACLDKEAGPQAIHQAVVEAFRAA